jgi:RNA polymerase sigma factor (sigma-70 family)
MMHTNAIVFEEVYNAYYRSLLKLVRRFICSHELAEDILQDAFIKIWRSLPNYDAGKAGLYTWMAAICTNMAIDHLRSKNYRKQCKNDELETMIDTIDGQRYVLPSTDYIDVISQLRILRTPYADVMMLFYDAGYTQVEIGRILGLPLGTVKSRIRIAVRDLRTLYAL